MSKRYDTKVPSIINRKVIKEEIIFRGKKIIRERVIKEFVWDVKSYNCWL